MINAFRVLVLIFSLVLGTSSAYGQDDKSKRTTINFEDQLIKGQNQKPDLLYLLQKKKFNYKRLIRLRENFLPEMRETATEVRESSKIGLKNPGKE